MQVTAAGLTLGLFFAWRDWLGLGRRKSVALVLALGLGVLALIVAALTTLAVQVLASLSLTLGAPVLSGGFPLVVGNVNTAVDMFLIGLALSALRDGGLPEEVPGFYGGYAPPEPRVLFARAKSTPLGLRAAAMRRLAS